MDKVNKNIFLAIGILVIIAFIILLFILNGNKKVKVKNENLNKADIEERYAQALYVKLNGIYFRDDLLFEQENNKNKEYTIENKKYYKVLDSEYVRLAFTDQGLLNYQNLSGLVIKDDEYYLPITTLNHNELLDERKFEIKKQSTDEIQYEITTSFCSDKERCLSKTTKKSNFKLKNVDGDWLIDSFEIDE